MSDLGDDGSPRLRMKVELRHSPRNQKKDVHQLEGRVEKTLNHPNERVVNIRIAVGREASGVFVTLTPKRWPNYKLDRVPRQIARELQRRHYADTVTSREWGIEAVTPSEE